MMSVLRSIQEKRREQDCLLAQLELWAKAEAQGIDSREGGSFGLDTRLFDSKERVRYQRGEFTRRDETGAIRVLMYNYFRYPDGRVVQLDPMVEAA